MLISIFFSSLVSLFIHGSFQLQVNNRPILGVLLQEVEGNITYQYIASSYVKFIEMAGARVVPIFTKRSPEYYTKLLNSLNGVLMPGGNTELLNTGYSEAADIIIETAISKYKQGTYFPIWCTCMSFEKLVTYFTGNTDVKWETMCHVLNLSLPLDFPADITAKNVRMLNGDEHIMDLLANYNVTANYHHICLSVDTFKGNRNLSEQFTLVSTNTYGGFHFVSTIEHKTYPIYSTQWHPEKAMFEWVHSSTIGHISHSWNAIQVGQHFANFLVNEARKNGQRFASKSEEAEALIYNFSRNLVFSGKYEKGSFSEIYIWPV